MKLCSKCIELKDMGDFSKHRGSTDGLQIYCKACKKIYEDTYREINTQRRNKLYQTIEGRFQRLLNSSRGRSKKKDIKFNIDLSFLLSLWEEQEGKCAISGEEMRLDHNKVCKTLNASPSLDRIDPSLGYTRDNIQLTCSKINYMKGSMSMDVFINTCRLIGDRYVKQVI